MASPLRIRKPPARAGTEEAAPPTNADGIKEYLGRLVKMIPTEVVVIYMVGASKANDNKLASLIWSIFCFLLVIIVRVFGTSDAKNKVPPEIPLVIFSALAFVVWLYSLGGPFTAYGLKNDYAPLVVLGYTFVVPYFYRQQ